MNSSYNTIPTQQPPNYSQNGDHINKNYYRNDETDPIYSTGGASPDDFSYGTNVADCDIEIRMAFIRKVYSILTLQLFGTALFSVLFSQVKPIQLFIFRNSWILILTSVLTFINLLALFWKRKSHPTNFILLTTFTALESVSIGTVISFYDQTVVLQAVLITLGLFLVLTLIAFQSKYDFTNWQPYLVTILWGIVLVSFVQIFFPFGSTFNLFIAIGTAILFSGFILVDTQMIITRLSPDEYIVASIELYLDVINLFLAILRILGNNDD